MVAGTLEQTLRVADTRVVTLFDALQGQGSDKGSTDTGTVLGGEDLNGVLEVLGPVKDLAQRLRTAGLEVGVLVEDGAVSTDVGLLPALLLANGSDTTSREARSARADELCEPAAELELGLVEPEAQPVLEEVGGFRKVLEGVPGNG